MKFGRKYKNHPTPTWVVIIQIILEYCFYTLAAGTLVVPDQWTWWKYVISGSGFLLGLWKKLQPYWGIKTTFDPDPNNPPV